MLEDDLRNTMNQYYAMCAPFHDGFMNYTGNEAMEDLLGPMIEWFEDDIRHKDVLEIACGTGNWTQVLSKRAQSVVATDVNQAALEIARRKPYGNARVEFRVGDAYALDMVEGTFDAAFAADWWSHIPKRSIAGFVDGLGERLAPGSRVILIDMLPREELDRMFSHFDQDGNRISRRPLPGGNVFEIVKNFPSKEELVEAFGKIAREIDYREHQALLRWMLRVSIL
jgi:SAM-dependent methyltransferase